VLQEIKLLVACRRPEVVTDDGQCFALLVAVLADHRDARLLPEGRIRQHHVVLAAATADQGIVHCDRIFAARAMEKQVHRTQARSRVHDLRP
jgi:hypothetical protein